MRKNSGACHPPSPVRRRVFRRWSTSALITAGVAVAAVAVSNAPAAAGEPDDPIATQAECTSDDDNLAARLTADVQDAVHRQPDGIGVAVYDRDTETVCRHNSSTTLPTASVVKTTLVGALLRQAQEEDRDLTDTEAANAHAAVTVSDNAAADALYGQLGVDGIQHFMDLVGMPDTVVTPTWGSSRSTADDQAALLGAITAPGDVLTDDRRAYLLELMGEVVSDQRWGTPAGAPDSVTVAVKNGWLPSSGWVNSSGAFSSDDRDYMMVVMTENSADMDAGVERNERVARAVHRALNPDEPEWPSRQEGSFGSRVHVAQTLLNHHGADLDVDSDFGPATDDAVRDFQSDNDLDVTGVTDVDTWQALAPDVELGDDSDAVLAAQERLIAFGHDVEADGEFDAGTQDAVSQFQTDHDLSDTGAVDSETWLSLVT